MIGRTSFLIIIWIHAECLPSRSRDEGDQQRRCLVSAISWWTRYKDESRMGLRKRGMTGEGELWKHGGTEQTSLTLLLR